MALASYRHLKANLLSFLVLGPSVVVGFVVGMWVVPVLIMLFGTHDISFGDFPLEAAIFPHVPEIIDPKKDRNQFLFLQYVSPFVGIFVAALIARLALRYNHYLIVKKFKWLSQEEAMRTEKHQWM